MTVTSKENAKLLSASTPVAGIVEIHEMKMDKDVMKMAALPNGDRKSTRPYTTLFRSMTVMSKENAKLIAASTPVAGIVEIHEMKMDKDVMKMAALPNGLDLPAGKAVDLKPGGYHIMLMDLKLPLNKDVGVPLTLTFQDSNGKKSQQVVQVPVSLQPPMGPGAGMHHSGEHKH